MTSTGSMVQRPQTSSRAAFSSVAPTSRSFLRVVAQSPSDLTRPSGAGGRDAPISAPAPPSIAEQSPSRPGGRGGAGRSFEASARLGGGAGSTTAYLSPSVSLDRPAGGAMRTAPAQEPEGNTTGPGAPPTNGDGNGEGGGGGGGGDGSNGGSEGLNIFSFWPLAAFYGLLAGFSYIGQEFWARRPAVEERPAVEAAAPPAAPAPKIVVPAPNARQ
eukprot:CAMPEP_0119102158 /NCGR_PEP_ID=MMETSP1180-20130426/1007_1 /TAXON_ID=3052 ORGANISM="Chlamydomonas cf sp, Strain CCMP681" /NCGR_SAMPLE_ID=MMETSP1180 /ASSEMBLY_ACC=CAM_ASM_000741 /LENGTH=215 /DNA_ID=CAMNT_0007086401 /DNA_START=22 /DNA_END=669 /DNA_ORIENTATION=-